MFTITFSPLTDYRQIGQELYESTETWKQEVGDFILKWVDSSDHILAQTSGSTGTPKEMRLPKSAMRNSALMTGNYFGFSEGQTALLCLSTRYIAGKMMVIRAMIHHMNLVLVEPGANPLLEVDFPVDFAAMVPLQVRELLQSESGIASLEQLDKLLIGGGAMDGKLDAALQPLNVQAFASYGMTETVSHIALRAVNGVKASTWFAPMDGVKLYSDERGCLSIDAPFLSDERIVTNDLVEFSGDHRFRVIGRVDNIISSGGIKINPEKIEEQLSKVIDQPFVISSLPDERLENRVVLIIEGDYGDKDGLMETLREVLTAHEVPKDIYTVQQLIRTETGKINRKETRSLLD
ncbi:MAG: AMP-binding protein [Bacteroidota bacterium]